MAMLARAALLSLLLLPACTKAPEAPPIAALAPPLTSARTSGRGYTVPIPAAYCEEQQGVHPEIDAILKAGGVALIETFAPDLKDVVRATLLVTPIAKLERQPDDPAACTALAGRMGKDVGAQASSARVVDLTPWKTCQWALSGFPEASRRARATIVLGPSTWMVRCDYDLRDRPAQEGCDQLLQGWRFESTELSPAEKAWIDKFEEDAPQCGFRAVHLHEAPRALLDEFLYRAARGDFLRTEAWLYSATTCPEFLPAPDEHTAIEGYRVVSFSVKGDSAEARVEYRLLGRIGRGPDGRVHLFENRRTEAISLELLRTPFGWRIPNGDATAVWQNVVEKGR